VNRPVPAAGWARIGLGSAAVVGRAARLGRARRWAVALASALGCWIVAVLPFARQLQLQGYDRSTTLVPLLGWCGLGLLGAATTPRLRPVVLAAGASWFAWRHPEVPSGARAVLLVQLGGWALWWGLLPLPRSLRPLRDGLVLASPLLLAAAGVLATRPGIATPAALTAAAAIVGLGSLAAPGPVAAVRDRLGDVGGAATEPLRRLGRSSVPLAARAARRVHGTLEPVLGPVLRPVHRVLRRVGRGLGTVIMVPAAALTSVLWVGERLVRYDPEPRIDPTTTWRERADLDPSPTHLFTQVRLPQVRPLTHRLHRGAALLVSAVLAFGPGTYDTLRGRAEHLERSAPKELPDPCKSNPDPAMDGQPGWPELGCELTEIVRVGRFDGAAVYRWPDYSGRYHRIRDGVRGTWRPPDCDCPRLRVWWFGGSFAWGWNQRDDFTPASQLAKAAWADGIALDIENRAMPGWTLGQEARTFAHLTTTQAPPDLVVFVDGGNDLFHQLRRNERGRGADESQASYAEAELDQLLANGPFSWGLVRDDAEVTLGGGQLPEAEVARHTLNRYRRDVELARRIGDANGIATAFAWQPSLPSGPREIGNPNAVDDAELARWQAALPVIRADLPAAVHDLSDSLDDVGRVVYKDVFHVNEIGADVVARDLYARLRPQLVQLRDGGPR